MTVTRFPRAPAVASGATDASFTVDAAAGTLLSAGRLAASLLDWDAAHARPKALDAAMPALAVLRAYAKHDRPSAVTRTLVLWSRSGAFVAHCKLEPAGSGDSIVHVTINNIQDLMAQRAADAVLHAAPEVIDRRLETRAGRLPIAAALAGGDASPSGLAAMAMLSDVPPPRDDLSTLQLIAQRIEDGVRLASRSEPPSADLPQEPATDEPGSNGGAFDVGLPPADTVRTDIAGGNLCLPEPPLPAEANDNMAIEACPPASADPRPELARILAQTAHDIKTPLSAITAASEIIRDERLGPSGNERYRSYAADIHASARHALAIVDRLMRLPPADGGAAKAAADHSPAPLSPVAEPEPGDGAVDPAKANTPPEFRAVDLNGLVSQSAAELKPLMDNQHLQLTLRLDPASPHPCADAVALKQALLNVLTNAMKFTPAGGAIQLETAKLSGHSVLLTVRDSGRGMTKAAIARHLGAETKSEVRRSARAAGSGLGLGLPQVLDFCRRNAAELAIDSTLGRGTAVTIKFAD